MEASLPPRPYVFCEEQVACVCEVCRVGTQKCHWSLNAFSLAAQAVYLL